MSNLDNNFDEENNITQQEQLKIDEIKIVSYATYQPTQTDNSEKYKETWTPLNMLGLGFIFNRKSQDFNNIKDKVGLTREAISFDPVRQMGISKVVTINNISGKKAWVVLSPAPIVSIGAIKIYKLGELTLETKGDYKSQQIYIPTNSRNEYDLDNSLTYISLFLEIDGLWKKVWLDRLFNTRKYNINILERHVDLAVNFSFVEKD